MWTPHGQLVASRRALAAVALNVVLEMTCVYAEAEAVEEIALWLDDIPRLIGEQIQFDALVALARDGLPEALLPSAVALVEQTLDGLPRLQTFALWELAAAAPSAAWACRLLREALRFSSRIADTDFAAQ